MGHLPRRAGLWFPSSGGHRGERGAANAKGPKKHISISILWGHPSLIGLHCKVVYMGYP